MKSFITLSGILAALSISSAPNVLAQGEPLQIYWSDVEGGSSTLIVTPGGDSVLMDAGWNLSLIHI